MDSEQLQGIWDSIIPFISQYGLRVIGAILILIAGRIAAGLVGSGVRKAMERAGADKGLVGFVSALARAAVLVFAVIAALGKFGVETASFVAVIGAAGFAIGFAMQGSLSNFASGVMILVFRPFKVGDAIDAAGSVGSVKEIGIFTTTLATFDNKKIIIPNSQVMGGTITNINAFDTRRVDLTAGIAYNDDIGQAKQILEGILEKHPKVLADPAPNVQMNEMADSSLNFIVRPWVKTEDYWTVFFEVNRSIKEEFDKAGISIPFPQRDVHVHQVS